MLRLITEINTECIESTKVLTPHGNCIKFQHYFQHFVVTDTQTHTYTQHAMFMIIIHRLTAFTYSIAGKTAL